MPDIARPPREREAAEQADAFTATVRSSDDKVGGGGFVQHVRKAPPTPFVGQNESRTGQQRSTAAIRWLPTIAIRMASGSQ